MFRRLFSLLIFLGTVSWAVMGQQVFGREHLQQLAQNWQQQGVVVFSRSLADKTDAKELHANLQATWQQVKNQVVPKLSQQMAEEVRAQVKAKMGQRFSNIEQPLNTMAVQLAQLDTKSGAETANALNTMCTPTYVFAKRYGLAQHYSQKNQAISDAFGLASL
jgi:2',3'-cyclic-nucleotide 2'-phosphodiesterase (5'-nucleotidase family)